MMNNRDMFKAVYASKYNVSDELLKNGIGINVIDNRMRTPL